VGVRLDRRRVLQQGLGDLPQPLDPVGTGEQCLVADHGHQDEVLVPLERVLGRERFLVLERHRGVAEGQFGARDLGQELGRDRAGVGEVDDDLVDPPGRDVPAVNAEHPQRRLVESQRDDLARCSHGLA
jgi:hypothetical protein